MRTTLFDATERRAYERELLAARERDAERRRSHAPAQPHGPRRLPDDPRFEIEALYQPGRGTARGRRRLVRHVRAAGRQGRDRGRRRRRPRPLGGRRDGPAAQRGPRARARRPRARGRRPSPRHVRRPGRGDAVRDARLRRGRPGQRRGHVHRRRPPAAGLVPPPRACSWAGRSTPLGVLAETLPRTEARFTLAPGEGFVLYTDGLVERRTENIETGIERVVAVLRDRPDASPEDLAAATWEAGAAEDDVCVLVFRRRMPSR